MQLQTAAYMPFHPDDQLRAVTFLSGLHKRLGEKSPLQMLEPGIVAQIMMLALPPVVERPICKVPDGTYLDEDCYSIVVKNVAAYEQLHFMCTITRDGIPVFQRPLSSPGRESKDPCLRFIYKSVVIPEYGRVEISISIDAVKGRKAVNFHVVREIHVDLLGRSRTLQTCVYLDDDITTFKTANAHGIEVWVWTPGQFFPYVWTTTWDEDGQIW